MDRLEDSGTFVIKLAGRAIGKESFRLEPEQEGLRLSGRCEMQVPKPLQQESGLFTDEKGWPRRLHVEAQSGERQSTLDVAFEEGRAIVSSSSSREEGAREESIACDPACVVLVRNALHQLVLLARRYDPERGGVQRFPLFRGQEVAVEAKPDVEVETAEGKKPLVHLFADVTGLYGVDLFLLDGRLVKIAIPLQRVEAIREGVPELEMPAAAAARAPVPSPLVRAEDVTFPSAGEVVLAGTLTLPEATGRAPGVVLVSGSGAQDRNEDSVGPGGLHYGIFRVIAERLTQEGIAVLRYDDRGAGKSTGSSETSALSDLTADARAAVAYLAGRPEIDPQRLGVVGHSEGGLIAALVATEVPAVKGVVMLGTPPRSLDEVLVYQLDQVLRRLGTDDARREAALKRRRESLQAIKQTGRWDAPEVEEALRQIPPGRRKWFEEHFAIEPLQVVKRVGAAVVVMQGGRDFHVDPADWALFEDALRGQDFRFIRFEALDHLFMPTEATGLASYADPNRRLDPAFLDELARQVRRALAMEG